MNLQWICLKCNRGLQGSSQNQPTIFSCGKECLRYNKICRISYCKDREDSGSHKESNVLQRKFYSISLGGEQTLFCKLQLVWSEVSGIEMTKACDRIVV
jgi:hypothetical protein